MLLRGLRSWLVREHWLIGAGLVRIMLGTWALYYYGLHFSVRHVLWGPDGLWPFDKFLESRPFLSIWALSRSPVAFEIFYVLGVLIAVAYTLGWWTRLAAPLHWLMIWSLQERNPFITDGGDNIMRIVLLFLILAHTGARFSLDAARRPWRLPETVRQALAVAHNFAILLVLAQLSLLYISTGLYKVMGEVWQNGTALYYILRVHEFTKPGLAELVYRNPYLVVLGTYGTVLFEVTFLPALFNPWTRGLAALAGVMFHVGIAVLMGLVTFAWSMLSLYPLLFTDRQYVGANLLLRRRLTLTVFYDGWCSSCTRTVGMLCALDAGSLLSFVSFREPGVTDTCGLDAAQLERRIQTLNAHGRLSEGMDAMVQIALRLPPLWIVVPALCLARVALGQRAYDFLASRRVVLVPAPCVDECRAGSTRTGRPSP